MARAPDPTIRAERINRAFLDTGYTNEFIDFWWTTLSARELAGRTALVAWGDQEYEAVEAAASAQLAKEPEVRAWIEETNARVSDGSISDEIAEQLAPAEIVDKWRAEHPSE